MDKANLIATAKELNELLGVEPAIPTKGNEADIAEKVKEAAGLLEPEDKISKMAKAVIAELNSVKKETTKPGSKKAVVADDDDDDDATEADDDDDDDEEEEAPAPAKKKAAAAKEDDDDEEEAPAPAKKKGPIKSAAKDGGLGVVATIADEIVKAGKAGISKADILEVLVAKFPEKASKSMASTINVQVPGRISKEKFLVEKLEGGLYRKAKEAKS